MPARLAILTAAPALLTGVAAFAQQPGSTIPPLPPLDAVPALPAPIPAWQPAAPPIASPIPPSVPDATYRYPAEVTGPWLDQCHASYGAAGQGYCEDYLRYYEAAMSSPGVSSDYAPAMPGYGVAMNSPAYGPAYGLSYGLPSSAGYNQGYVPPGYAVPPFMWVRVPIMRETQAQPVVEEVIEEEPAAAPAPVRRTPPRAVPGKTVRITK